MSSWMWGRGRYRPYVTCEWTWTRFGLGFDASFGAWWPREWGLYVQVGFLLLGFSLEDRVNDIE